jgi:mxaD protein
MIGYVKQIAAGFCVAIFSSTSVLAAEAPELSVRQTIIIDAPTDQVWEVVSDFNGLPKWFPFIKESRLVLGENRRLGAIRELTRGNGTKVEEKLIGYDPYNMSATYTYMGGKPLTSDYFSTMTVTDAGDGKSMVEWKARFKRLQYWTDTAPEGQEDETLVNLLNKVYTIGLESLKKYVESPAE